MLAEADVPLLRLVTGRFPVTPVVSGRPVALVRIAADGVPKSGVTSVGLVANTSEPLPVSSVTEDARLAEDGVPRKVAMPLPRLVIPVPPLATGSAVPLYVIARVPAPVIGLPEIDKTLGTVAATLVTVSPDEGELLVTVKLG